MSPTRSPPSSTISLSGWGRQAITRSIRCSSNLGYYGAFYALFRARAITFDMQTIILMFGFGMVVHYVISLMQERLFLRRRI